MSDRSVNEILSEEFCNSPSLLKAWIDLCTEYLDTKPDHENGFCYWATCRKGFYQGYEIGITYTKLFKKSDSALWITQKSGPTPTRIKFVRWMRSQAKKTLSDLK